MGTIPLDWVHARRDGVPDLVLAGVVAPTGRLGVNCRDLARLIAGSRVCGRGPRHYLVRSSQVTWDVGKAILSEAVGRTVPITEVAAEGTIGPFN
jgi:hypothetical protein